MDKGSSTPEAGAQSQYKMNVRSIIFALAAILTALAVATYSPSDTAVIEGGSSAGIRNAIGLVGAYTGRFLFYWFGIAVYPVVVLLVIGALRAVFPRKYPRRGYWPGLLLAAVSAALLFGLNPDAFIRNTAMLGIGHAGAPELALSGGVIGQWLAGPGGEAATEGVLRALIGAVGTLAVGWLIGVMALVLMLYADWRDLGEYIMSRPPRQVEDEPPATVFVQEEEPPPSEERRRRFGFFRRHREEEPPPPVAAVEQPLPLEEPIVNEDPQPSRWEVDDKPLTSIMSTRKPQPAAVPVAAEAPARSGASLALANGAAAMSISIGGVAAEKQVAVASASVSAPSRPVVDTVPDMPEPEPVMADTTPDITPTRAGQAVAVASQQEYVVPPISMLSGGGTGEGMPESEIIRARGALQDVLESFGVDAHVGGYVVGPRVTRFEITLARGVDVGKIVKLEQNIKLTMCVNSIRIQAPIPGQEAVGVEVPNSSPQAVFARDIMESAAWQNSTADIPIVLGKNVSGDPIVIDLAKAPHLLIAGATGSGKSVCMNCLIMSLLMRFPVDELQLIMVDPKVVELEFYRRLPQLITPVINDSEKVPLALRWAVNEMEKRYRLLARARVKKLTEYNDRMRQAGAPITDETGTPMPKKMPFLVVILDELADVMMTEARRDVETCINRIAAKGRAAGVHIVVATQSPRKDVVTGLIKANLPTRIAFMVSGQMDSRVILDRNGAEMLLGKGDMLLMASGGNLERVQGAMVRDEDIDRVVEFIAGQRPQSFDDGVVSDNSAEAATGSGEDAGDDRVAEIVQKYLEPGDDELVARALEVIIVERKASTSALQRRLKIGYNRAAELMDLFEERRLIGPDQQGGKQREVLVYDGLEDGEY